MLIINLLFIMAFRTHMHKSNVTLNNMTFNKYTAQSTFKKLKIMQLSNAHSNVVMNTIMSLA